jgi:uncharacterized protein (TIGR02147 family)
LFSKWFYPVILELIRIVGGRIDETNLGKMCVPRVSKREVKRAVSLLCDLGLVKRHKDGRLECIGKIQTTGDPVDTVAVHGYQRSMMTIAQSSLDRLDKDRRDISTLTVSLDDAGFSAIKRKVERLRSEILDIAAATDNEDRVVQLNLQSFHVSRVFENE